MTSVKWMDLNEFRDKGFLQEVNRKFFHPLGLALAITIDNKTGSVLNLAGVHDHRDDPEGIYYSEGVIDQQKIDNVKSLFESKRKTREKILGGIIQES